jgi:hypothetical protein
MADHDHGYKLLFSHPAMVADLLRGFVHEDWVQHLDFSTLEKVGSGYVSDDLRSRESDIVWRARWGESWLYVYLLLEFQSSVDPFMAVRVMTYVGLLYQDLIRRGWLTPGGLLPPVLPLVLYNGLPPWRAAEDVADLVEAPPGGLERYRPRLRYFLLDEMRIAESELASLRNVAAALFRLETSRGPEDIQRVVVALIQWLGEPEHQSLRRAFTVWLRRVLLPARVPGVAIPEVLELQEVRDMLAERVIEWTREWKEEGLQEGWEKGREEALRESTARLRQVVLRLLDQRFHPVPGTARHKVEAMQSLDELAVLAERILTVSSLAELGLE